ncbi:laminin subunit alpha-1-like, partial [Sycon ciliatum]|uniref:laminin subunit alpha-1-like n=1 Tax=Sycon ciliatum TaxID=27933 RepID=UPI0031F663B2
MQHTPYPAPTVEWFHDGSRIDANTDRVQLSNGSLSLTLINLTLSDEGAYTFMVRNDQGSDSAMFNMDIAVPPCPSLQRRAADGVSCIQCSCDANATKSCNDSDSCTCLDNYSGLTCQDCAAAYYRTEEQCVPCSCNPHGSHDNVCDQGTGQCSCMPGFNGTKCSECPDGFFIPDPSIENTTCVAFDSNETCQACYCSVAGSVSSVCANGAGICQCRPGYTGDKCDSCTSPGQFYATNAGCTELSDELFTGIKSSLVQGSVLNLSYEFVYGSQFTHHGQVSVSYDGFMSLNGISGGEDINFRVTEEDAVIAPYWTSRNGNQS